MLEPRKRKKARNKWVVIIPIMLVLISSVLVFNGRVWSEGDFVRNIIFNDDVWNMTADEFGEDWKLSSENIVVFTVDLSAEFKNKYPSIPAPGTVDLQKIPFTIAAKHGETEVQPTNITPLGGDSFEGKYKVEIPFNHQGRLDVNVMVLNNVTEWVTHESSDYFFITRDSIAPVISISGPEDGLLYPSDINVKVQVEEENHNSNTVTVLAKRNDEVYTNVPDWTNTQKTSSLDYLFKEDGDYELTVSSTDAHGNVGIPQTIKFSILKGAPGLTLKEKASNTAIASNGYTSSTELQALVESSVSIEKAIMTIKKGSESDTVDLIADRRTASVDFLVSEGNYEITIEVTSRSKGNPYTLGPIMFTVDTSHPEVSLSSEEIEGKKKITGNVFEKFLDLNLSKITKTLKTLNGENQTNIPFTVSDQSTYTAFDTVSEDGVYIYDLSAVDKAGNLKNDTLEFIIDNTEPLLSIKDEENNDPNNKYFNKDKKVLVSVKDLTLDLNPVKTELKVITDNAGEKKEEIVSLIQKLFNFAEVEKTFSADGKYSFELSSEDQKGNFKNDTVNFVIDQTPPKLEINNVNNEETYGGTQDIELKVIDENFDFSNTKLKILRDGVEVDELPNLELIEENGKQMGALKRYRFDQDGYYEIHFESMDKALNKTVHPPVMFTIDQEDPILIVDGVESNGHYPGLNGVIFTIEDLTLDIEKVKPVLKVTKEDGSINEYDNWKKDGRGRIKTAQQVLSFNEEGDYKIEFSGYDTKENSYSIEPIHFTIDKRSPGITFSGIGESSFVKEGNVNVQIEEHNYDHNKVEVYYQLNGSEEKYILPWKNEGEISKEPYPFNIEGYYEFTVVATDKAGNKSEQKRSFTVDKTEPKIRITGAEHNSYNSSSKEVKIEVDERNYSNNAVGITVTRKVEVDGASVDFPIGEWKNVNKISDLGYVFNQDGEYQINVNATDAAGNIGATEKLLFTIDKIDPELSISGVDNEHNYRTDKPVNFSIADRNIDLSQTNLKVQRNGKDYNIGELSMMGKISAVKTFTFSEEGSYLVTLDTKDKAGRGAQDKREFIIDKTNPVVNIVGVDNNSYNPTGKNVMISVDELNFDTNNVDISATKDGLDFNIGKWENSGKLSKLGYNFNQDGLYTVLATAEDKAGNGPISKKMTFTVDKVKPSIEITGVDNNAYYNVDKPVNVTIKDLNLDINKINVTRNGAPYSAGGFSVNGDLASFRHNFSGEGDYNIVVEATDKAGNSFSKTMTFTIDKTKPVITPKFKGQNRVIKNGEYINEVFTPEFALDEAEDTIVSATLNNGGNLGKNIPVAAREMSYTYKVLARDKAGNESTLEISFTLDTTKPMLNISGVLDGFFNKDIAPKVTYSDIHLDRSKTSVTLNGKPFENGTKLEYEQDYILKAVVTDLAKNVSARTIVFTIDKTKPVIKFKEPISNNYFNTDLLPQLLIEDMSSYDIIAMMLDGKPYKAGDPIKEEGKHVMFFEVKDKAGNIQQLSVEFIIDKTAPKVVYEGVKNKEKYYDPVDIVIRLDNPNDKIKSVMINGELFDGEVVEENGYKVIKTTVAEIKPYEIAVTAYDDAENEKTTVISFEIVEKGALVKFYENKPLLGGTLAGAIGLIAAASTVLARRRKMKVEEE